MKYTTKQLLGMSINEIDKICPGCIFNKCLFKPLLRECREDGYCITETYNLIDYWIEVDQEEIKQLENQIKKIQVRIEKYKKWKKTIEKDVEKHE